MQTKKHVLFTIYLGLVSLISFIGLAITVIVFAHEIISNNIITDDEYVSQNHREIDRCNEPLYLQNFEKGETTKRTEQEKQECVNKAKENLILQRHVNSKETMIMSGLRAFVLLIIFPLHFIYFKKHNK